jgi:Ca-activated chloride channel family protein
METKDIITSLREMGQQAHKAPEGFTDSVMQKVYQQKVSHRRLKMKAVVLTTWSLVWKFLLPLIFILVMVPIVLLESSTTSAIHKGALLSIGLLICFGTLAILFKQPRTISRTQRMAWASGLLSVAAIFFVTRSSISLFFGADYVDFEASDYDGNTPSVSSQLEERRQVFASSKENKASAGAVHMEQDSRSTIGVHDLMQSAPHFAKDELQRSPQFNTENYTRIEGQDFLETSSNPLSTFSIDVDTASYSNIRRFLQSNTLPPRDAVRLEEMINYFKYDYPRPTSRQEPFTVSTELSRAPWRQQHYLLQIGLQGIDLSENELAPSNLVFLIDVSGSMDAPNKLGLLKSSFRLLVEKLGAQDRISIVVYAGAAGTVLSPTPGNETASILSALERLQAGGSTAGSAGIERAYALAQQNFISGGNNRVILATDGDFNVGISSDAELTRMIEEKREAGVYLSVLGFGTGNYKDSRMEQLADKGNGNYAYIDSILEAKKVLVNDMRGTLFTIAKDVKIQIEFNPQHVQSYRLIGYENRALRNEDFNDDTKDAGELGAGHSVTALYEIVPVGIPTTIRSVDPLRYQTPSSPQGKRHENELATVKFRYKLPKENRSRLVSASVSPEVSPLPETSNNFRFASAVAQFGLLLRESKYKGASTYESTIELARGAKGKDQFGYRSQFIELVETAKLLGASR